MQHSIILPKYFGASRVANARTQALSFFVSTSSFLSNYHFKTAGPKTFQRACFSTHTPNTDSLGAVSAADKNKSKRKPARNKKPTQSLKALAVLEAKNNADLPLVITRKVTKKSLLPKTDDALLPALEITRPYAVVKTKVRIRKSKRKAEKLLLKKRQRLNARKAAKAAKAALKATLGAQSLERICFYQDKFTVEKKFLILPGTDTAATLYLSPYLAPYIQKKKKQLFASRAYTISRSGRKIELHTPSEIIRTAKGRRHRLLRLKYANVFIGKKKSWLNSKVPFLAISETIASSLSFRTYKAFVKARDVERNQVKSDRRHQLSVKYEKQDIPAPLKKARYRRKTTLALAWRRIRALLSSPVAPKYLKYRRNYIRTRLSRPPVNQQKLKFTGIARTQQKKSDSSKAFSASAKLRYRVRKRSFFPFFTSRERAGRSCRPRQRKLQNTARFYLALKAQARRTLGILQAEKPQRIKTRISRQYRRHRWQWRQKVRTWHATYFLLVKNHKRRPRKIRIKDANVRLPFKKKKRIWRNTRRKRKTSLRQKRLVGDRRPQTRKVQWPIVNPQKRQYRHSAWKRRQLSRKRGKVNVAKTFFRLRAGLSKTGFTTETNFRSLRRTQRNTLKTQLPYYSLNYGLKPRKWHTPRDSAGVPLAPVEISEREKNRRILRKDLRHYEKRRRRRTAWSRKKSAERRQLLLTAYSKERRPPKFRDNSWRNLELRTGYPATLGYRYERRLYRNNFITNRWWQPAPEPTVVHHPFALIDEEHHPEAFLNHPERLQYYTSLGFRQSTFYSARNAPLISLDQSRDSSNFYKEAENEFYRIRDFPNKDFSIRNSDWRKFFMLIKGNHSELNSRYAAIHADVDIRLEVRPNEKILAGVSQETWASLAHDYNRSHFPGEVRVTAPERHLAAIEYDRLQLFAARPNWWAEEARLYRKALRAVTNLLLSIKFKKTRRRLRHTAETACSYRKNLVILASLLKLPENWSYPQIKQFLINLKRLRTPVKSRTYSGRRLYRKESRQAYTQSTFNWLFYSFLIKIRIVQKFERAEQQEDVLRYLAPLKKYELVDSKPSQEALLGSTNKPQYSKIISFLDEHHQTYHPTVSEFEVNPRLKENGTAHQRYISRQRAKEKKTNGLTSSLVHETDTAHVIYNLPSEQPRFPAVGGRKLSYTRSLRVFYRKRRTPRLRAVGRLHYKFVDLSRSDDAKASHVPYQNNPGFIAQRRRLRKLSSYTYLPKNARVHVRSRSLLRQLTACSLNKVSGQIKNATKRRFARSPLFLVQKESNLSSVVGRRPCTKGHSGYLARVLRSTRERRANLRVVTDKKKLIRQRRLRSEQCLPRWRRLRARRRAAAHVDSKKTQRKNEKYCRTKVNTWVRQNQKVIRLKRQRRAISTKTTTTSGLALTAVSRIRRAPWATYGYTRQSRSRLHYIKTLSASRLVRRRKLLHRIYKLRDEPTKSGRTKRFLDRWRKKGRKKKKSFRKRRARTRSKMKFRLEKRRALRGKRYIWGSRLYNRAKLRRATSLRRQTFLEKACLIISNSSQKKLRSLLKKKTNKMRAYRRQSVRKIYARGLRRINYVLNVKKVGRRALKFKELPSGARVSEKMRKIQTKKKLKKTTSRRVLKNLLSVSNTPSVIFYPDPKETVNVVVCTRKDKSAQLAETRTCYRLVAEISNSTNQLFSNLISWLRKCRSEFSPRTLEDAEKFVLATYWNLRVYLGQDYLGLRLWTKDNARELRYETEKEINLRARGRAFGLSQTKDRRRRTQPHWLTRKEPKRAASLTWLRHWFPRLYKFHLENPDNFEDLTFTRTEGARVKPTSAPVEEWATQKIVLGAELTFERLVKAETTGNTSRYESMLMTVRRGEQTTACAQFLKQSAFKTVLPSSTPRTAFFAKRFSTKTTDTRNGAVTTLLVTRATQQNLANTENENRRSPYHLARVYPKRKARLNLLGLSGHTRRLKETREGVIDPRVIRHKSPRNARYWQRRPRTVGREYREMPENKEPEQREKTFAGKSRFIRSLFTPAPTLNFQETSLQKNRQFAGPRRRSSVENPPLLLTSYESPLRILSLGRTYREHSLQRSTETLKISRSQAHDASRHRSIEVAAHKPKVHRNARVYFKQERLHHTSFYRTRFRYVYAARAAARRALLPPPVTRVVIRKPQLQRPSTQLLLAPPTIRSNESTNPDNLTIDCESFLIKVEEVQEAQREVSGCFELVQNPEKGFIVRRSGQFLRQVTYFGRNVLNGKRSEFWEKLTARFYLKGRFVKTWIKDRKRILLRTQWHYIPEILFKERRARLRLLEWHESDRHFFRKGWKKAFNFYPSEKQRAPWLEPLRRRRTSYSTRHGEYRRYSFPREQKSLKSLQYYRKARINNDPRRRFLKTRRWPRLRTMAYRRYRSLFDFRNTRVAQKHFKKLSKQSTKTTGFSRNAEGTRNRLDITLLFLGITKTVYWSRVIAPLGIVKINGKRIFAANHLLKQGDVLSFNWGRISRIQEEFKVDKPHYLRENIRPKIKLQNRPKNFSWHPGLRVLRFNRRPVPGDLVKNSRVARWSFDSFRRDAGIGRK